MRRINFPIGNPYYRNSFTNPFNPTSADFSIETIEGVRLENNLALESIAGIGNESFSSVASKVSKVVKDVLAKIGELIQKIIKWFKDKFSKGGGEQKAKTAEEKFETMEERFNKDFASPETREKAIEILTSELISDDTTGYKIASHILYMLTDGYKKQDVLSTILTNSPVFSVKYFTLKTEDRSELLNATTILLRTAEEFKNGFHKLRYYRTGNDTDFLHDMKYSTDGMYHLLGLLSGGKYIEGAETDEEVQSIYAAAKKYITELTQPVTGFIPAADVVRNETFALSGRYRTIKTNVARLEKVSQDIKDIIKDIDKLPSNDIVTKNIRLFTNDIDICLKLMVTIETIYDRITTEVLNSCKEVGKLIDKAIGRPSTESISFQDGGFFKELVAHVAKLRESGYSTPESIKRSGFEELIFKHTGMSVELSVDRTDLSINAGIMLPSFDRNHPFFSDIRRFFDTSENALNMIKDANGCIDGIVDLKNARVGGVFSQVKTQMYIAGGMMRNKAVTNEMIAAAICHELGHLYTFFEVFGRTFTTTCIIAAASAGIFDIEDQEARRVIIAAANEKLDNVISDDEVARLAALPKGKRSEVTQTVLVTNAFYESRTATGARAYELRSCEQLADEFAIKIGAGRHLAEMNDFIYRNYNTLSTQSRTRYVLSFVFDILVTIFRLVAGAIAIAKGYIFYPFLMITYVALDLLMANPTELIYDRDKQRQTSIKRFLTEALKDPTLTAERKKYYLGEIEAVTELEKTLKDRLTWHEYVVKSLGPRSRKEFKQEQILKDIENLMTNDLFTKAAQFSLGAS